ncbi:MAG TPA: type III restriction endonuclease subunit R, partial [Treponema sp.]|nr:type III restriction endonuclease subunit R [Treponema sp.]
NPNVFQICTLNETRSEVKKRQEIGRGMRLCVNQRGERIHNMSVNTLTVMANESYQEFAQKLQKEYETEEGIRFGVLEAHSFANISIPGAGGTPVYLGHQASEAIFRHFVEKHYIDAGGNVQDTLRLAVKTQNVDIPEAYAAVREEIIGVAEKACGSLNVKPAGNRRTVTLNKAVYLSPDFKQLWDNIKYKTTYNVAFDTAELIAKCITGLHDTLSVEAEKLIFTKARTEVNESGIETHETDRRQIRAVYFNQQLPDVIRYLQNETDLTRKSIVEILVRSGTLDLFKKNPQKYMEEAQKILKKQMQSMLVDGIKYTRIGDDAYYAQELFETEELTGYLERNMLPGRHSVYEYVVYDSDTEQEFARKFEDNTSIKCYAKLPGWFKIPTPLGPYNPDWALLVEKDDETKLYFVVETKADLDTVRTSEADKISCGKKAVEAMGTAAKFEAVDDYNAFMEKI